MKRGPEKLYERLEGLGISYEYHEHEAAPTIEKAVKAWEGVGGTRCKNLFFRNHKGNRHYLVILEHKADLAIRDLEQRLKQGKLTMASPWRLEKYLGVKPGSVTPFGLICDDEKHVHLFIDEKLQKADRLSFHPMVNTASLVVSYGDFIRFLDAMGNSREFIKLYDQ